MKDEELKEYDTVIEEKDIDYDNGDYYYTGDEYVDKDGQLIFERLEAY